MAAPNLIGDWLNGRVDVSNKQFRRWAEVCGASFLVLEIVESVAWKLYTVHDYATFALKVTLGISLPEARRLVCAVSALQLSALAAIVLNRRRSRAVIVMTVTHALELAAFRSLPFWRALVVLQVALSNAPSLNNRNGSVGVGLLSPMEAASSIGDALSRAITWLSLGTPCAIVAVVSFAKAAFAPLLVNSYEAQLGRDRFSAGLQMSAFFFRLASYDRQAPAVKVAELTKLFSRRVPGSGVRKDASKHL